MEEIEIKLQVPPERRAAVRKEVVGRTAAAPLRLQAAYDLHRAERRLKKTAVRRLWKAGSDRGRRVA